MERNIINAELCRDWDRRLREIDLFDAAETPLPADEPGDFLPWQPWVHPLVVPAKKLRLHGSGL
jgi:hypothetical protein